MTKTLATLSSKSDPGMVLNMLKGLAVAVVGSWLIAISAQVAVPMYPVPMTMQTWAVLLLPALFGVRAGTAAAVLYLAQGALGAPVFANGASGIARLIGPTGGFLIMFPVAALAVGLLMQQARARGFVPAFGVMLLGHGIIFAGGLAWLTQAMPFEKAVAVGFVPFIAGSIAKSLLVAAIIQFKRPR